ncbi:glycosyl transferase family protein [Govanella unica]|uniref:Glycosyl transferase family protein n=1 Tax=Govanella unica TaxID=2975056 RepID=A0A9X3TYY3_9PROT|nr:glycosyl transferase family protein [Govania unica]MDA5194290.1 glycosyl transferase family protein [Govania unica]
MWFLHDVTVAVAILLLLFGIDDLIVDLFAYGRRFYRAFVVYRRHRRLDPSDLRAVAEQPIAVMIPAWAESEVIDRMIAATLSRYDYQQYRLFIGLYPNDPLTRTVAEIAAARDPRVTLCAVPHAGPTSKADCLNAIYASICAHEQESGERFEIFLLHDAEDVVHPLELRLMNYLIPRKDMVQLPVVPLARALHDFTSGHYLDEFAESHGKDMFIREWLTGSVPSAGVGCGFSRRAMSLVASTRGGQPFNSSSLTEDYDFALTLNYLGLKQIFVRFRVGGELVATQEYFPDEITAACRQKARWLIGIVFQSFVTTGWRGSLGLKYALYRDRKGVLTAFFGVICYVLAALWLLVKFTPLGPDDMGQSQFLAILLGINSLLLFNRSLQRAICVTRLYGWRQGLISIPRQVWGNVINFLAASRAIRLFLSHLRTGIPLGWDKTRHSFPDAARL